MKFSIDAQRWAYELLCGFCAEDPILVVGTIRNMREDVARAMLLVFGSVAAGVISGAAEMLGEPVANLLAAADPDSP